MSPASLDKPSQSTWWQRSSTKGQYNSFLNNDPDSVEYEFEDTKGVTRICKSKNKQHNGQNTKVQRSTKHTYKIKDHTKY
jgi:hypothetical protein